MLDWDVDEIPADDRLTQEEKSHYVTLAVTGVMTLTECKADLQSLLNRKPFVLDLIQMRKISLFDGLPDYSLRQFWADTIIMEWENHVPRQLLSLMDWGELTMTWRLLDSLSDGCSNAWLRESLEEQEKILIEDEDEALRLLIEAECDELWRKNVGCDWLHEMRFIINYSCILFY